jgi:hypothetical protein
MTGGDYLTKNILNQTHSCRVNHPNLGQAGPKGGRQRASRAKASSSQRMAKSWVLNQGFRFPYASFAALRENFLVSLRRF